MIIPRLVAAALLAVAMPGAGAAPCSGAAGAEGWTPPGVEGPGGEHLDLDALESVLSRRRVIYVGEIHDRYDHHLNQLEIICRLARHGPLAIGLEFFQTPAQAALDAYVQHHGDLQRLLRESEWFTRWRFDPRLYAPILRFARARRIALVALNVPGELVHQVARHGLASLDAADRARLPASIADGPPDYVQRLRRVFEQHPDAGRRSFANFVQAQMLWDEGMAQHGAEELLAHPRRRLVVLAGEGHIAFGDAIPDRLSRRVDAPHALVLQSHDHAPGPQASDYRLDTREVTLPAPGMLGVRIRVDDGVVRVQDFGNDSAARDAGVREGDRLTALDGHVLRSVADVRLVLWDKAPGDAVTVSVERDGKVRDMVLALR